MRTARRFVTVIGATVAMVASTLLATPAALADDGRAATPESEVIAQFQHSLDRAPDAQGLENYMSFVRENCHWGVVDASYRIATSGEAVERWGGDPVHLAGMLYASLLNRAPDEQGLVDYAESIRVRGLSLSTAEMLGSREYRDRLGAICEGDDSYWLPATMRDWQSAMTFAEDVLVKRAFALGVTCGVLKGVKKFTGLKEGAKGARLFIGAAGEVTNKIHGKLDDTCGTAVSYLKAAVRIAEIVDAGPHGYNPVFIQFDIRQSNMTATLVDYISIRIGPLPTEWTEYEGKVGNACYFPGCKSYL